MTDEWTAYIVYAPAGTLDRAAWVGDVLDRLLELHAEHGVNWSLNRYYGIEDPNAHVSIRVSADPGNGLRQRLTSLEDQGLVDEVVVQGYDPDPEIRHAYALGSRLSATIRDYLDQEGEHVIEDRVFWTHLLHGLVNTHGPATGADELEVWLGQVLAMLRKVDGRRVLTALQAALADQRIVRKARQGGRMVVDLNADGIEEVKAQARRRKETQGLLDEL